MLYSTDKYKPWKHYTYTRVYKYGMRNYRYTHSRIKGQYFQQREDVLWTFYALVVLMLLAAFL